MSSYAAALLPTLFAAINYAISRRRERFLCRMRREHGETCSRGYNEEGINNTRKAAKRVVRGRSEWLACEEN